MAALKFDRVGMPTAERQRLGFLDSIRGLAALLVLFQHALEQSDWIAVRAGFGYSTLNLGQVGVVAFFLISGFVIPISLERKGSVCEFAIGRVLRIYPLYLFLFAANILLFQGDHVSSLSLTKFLGLCAGHLLLIQDYIGMKNYVPASWTLSVEAVWYALFAFIFWADLRRRHMLVCTVASAIVLTAAATSLSLGIRLPLGRLCLLLLCLIGLTAYRRYTNEIEMRSCLVTYFILTSSVCVGQWVAFGYFAHAELSLRSVVNSWAAGAALFFFAYFSRQCQFATAKSFIYLGKISYSLYLSHPIIIHCGLVLGLSGSWLLVYAICVTIPVSSLLHRFIEVPGGSLRRTYLDRRCQAKP